MFKKNIKKIISLLLLTITLYNSSVAQYNVPNTNYDESIELCDDYDGKDNKK